MIYPWSEDIDELNYVKTGKGRKGVKSAIEFHLMIVWQEGDVCLDTTYSFSRTCCSPFSCVPVTERTSTWQDETSTSMAASCMANGGTWDIEQTCRSAVQELVSSLTCHQESASDRKYIYHRIKQYMKTTEVYFNYYRVTCPL